VVGCLGEIGKGPVPAGRVGQGDDDRGVQVAIWGEQLGAHGQAAGEAPRFQGGEFDAEQAGQVTLSAGVELVEGGGHGRGGSR
ncbi:MAG: hypothetical protein ACM3PS_08400, partial [Syntrophothermus sp.]